MKRNKGKILLLVLALVLLNGCGTKEEGKSRESVRTEAAGQLTETERPVESPPSAVAEHPMETKIPEETAAPVDTKSPVETENPEDTPVPKVGKDPVSAEGGELLDKVKEIDEYCKDIDKNKEDYSVKEQENGVIRYQNQDAAVLIHVPLGVDEIGYERNYYFMDGQLCYAYVFFEGEEHSMYFADDLMFRYVDQNGKIYDNSFTKEEFIEWESWTRQEAGELYQ